MHHRCRDGYTQLDIYGAGYSAGKGTIAKSKGQWFESSRTSQNKERKPLGDFPIDVWFFLAVLHHALWYAPKV
jgi:hypothetical protein